MERECVCVWECVWEREGREAAPHKLESFTLIGSWVLSAFPCIVSFLRLDAIGSLDSQRPLTSHPRSYTALQTNPCHDANASVGAIPQTTLDSELVTPHSNTALDAPSTRMNPTGRRPHVGLENPNMLEFPGRIPWAQVPSNKPSTYGQKKQNLRPR